MPSNPTLQVRARGTNLWLDWHERPRGQHANATMLEAPILLTYGPGFIPWAVIVVTRSIQTPMLVRCAPHLHVLDTGHGLCGPAMRSAYPCASLYAVLGIRHDLGFCSWMPVCRTRHSSAAAGAERRLTHSQAWLFQQAEWWHSGHD